MFDLEVEVDTVSVRAACGIMILDALHPLTRRDAIAKLPREERNVRKTLINGINLGFHVALGPQTGKHSTRPRVLTRI